MLEYKLDVLFSLAVDGTARLFSVLKWFSVALDSTNFCVNTDVPDKDALFQVGRDTIMSPLLPVYDVDDNLLGVTYPSRKGLCLYSTPRLTDDDLSTWDMVTSSSILLSSYKIVASKIVDNNIVEYSIPDESRPLLALAELCLVPSSMADRVKNRVHAMALYNMLTNRVLYVDCTSDKGISTILDALPQLANVDIQEDIIRVSLSDGVLDADSLMNCCEEKAALGLCHPEVYTASTLNIDEPCAEFNFYSPTVRLNSIVISPRTGTTKLKIYNLKSYNHMYVRGYSNSERTIILSSNSNGCLASSGAKQKAAIKIICTDMFTIDFMWFSSLSISADHVNTLHLESGKHVDLSRIRCIDRLILNSVENVEGFSCAKLQYLSTTDTNLNNLVVLDATEYVSVENGTFSNSSIVHSDYAQCRGGIVKSVEFEDVPVVDLDYADLEDVTIHQGTMLCLGDSNFGACRGNIIFKEKAPAEHEEFTFAYRFFRSYISIDMVAEDGLLIDDCEICTLDFTSCSASEITLNVVLYAVDIMVRRLADYADSYTWLTYFTSIFNRLEVAVPKNAKLNIVLDLKHFCEDKDIATRRVDSTRRDDVSVSSVYFTKKARNIDLMCTPYFVGAPDSDDSISRKYQKTYRRLINRLREHSNLTFLSIFELFDLT